MMAKPNGAASSTGKWLPREERSRRLSLYLEDTLRDIRLSCRTLGRNPGFTIVAIATLALGIGVNTAVFTLFDAVVLRPLPVRDPHQIVNLGQAGYPGDEFSFPEYLHIEKTNHTFSGLIGYDHFLVYLSADGFTERLWGELTSSNYTDVLGIEPIVGRGFLPDEGRIPARDPVAMISARLWRERFHSAQNILGKTVRLNGHPFTLVGVMPANFKGIFGRQDVWVPMMMQPRVSPPNRLDDANYRLRMIGRLKPDINLESAQSSLAAVVPQLELDDPKWKDQVLRLAPGHRGTRGEDMPSEIGISGIILVAIMGSVLFIACTNVANLLLSRATGRRLEMAIRLAAGASRRRLLRYLLTETTVLFLAGGAAAVLVAPCVMAMTSVLSLPSHLIPQALLDFGLELENRTLFFTLFLSLSTAMIFGLAPAAHSSRIDLFSELKATKASGSVRSVGLAEPTGHPSGGLDLYIAGCGRTLHPYARPSTRSGPGVRARECGHAFR